MNNEQLRVLLIVEQLRRNPPGGIGTYALGLIQGLGELAGDQRLEVELLASRARSHPDPLVALGHPIRASRLPGPALTRLWDRGMVTAPSGFDVVHAVSLATMECHPTPLVSTVHDLLWRRLPEAYPERGRTWHEAALHRSLRRARRFIVPADVVAHDLIEAGAPPDAVDVVPMGCDHLPPPDEVAGAALLARLGIAGPFLLSVGTLEPRKNLPRLLDAYRRIRHELPEPWPLVMVGPTGWGEQLPEQQGVVFTGMVEPAELSALYAQARLLAYVPLIEGFGLPPVEAMVFGTPVVASPLPSTAGAALEVDPHDTDAIAQGLLSGAVDEALRDRLREAGWTRSAELRWSVIAQRHVAIWEEVARG